jgi:hypothetical protein
VLTPHKFNKPAPDPAPAARGNRWRVIAACAVLVAVGALAYYWLRNDGTVTLNVKNTDVREVVKEIARQSGIEIILASNASGTVTLNLRKRSVGEALSAVAAQTGGFWQEYYAVADSRDSIEQLKRFHREGGEAVGWQRRNWVPRDLDGHRISLGNNPDQITYRAIAQPARDVALALTYRMSRESELVVADSLSEKLLTLSFDKRSQVSVVNEVAKQLQGELQHFIVMRPGIGRANVASRTDRQLGEAPPWLTGNRSPTPRRERANPAPSGATLASAAAQPAGPAATAAAAASEPAQSQPSAAAQRPEPAQSAGAAAASAARPRWGGGFGAGGAVGGPEQQAEAQREWQRHLNAMSPEQRARAEQIAAQFSQIKTPQEFAQAANSYLRENPAELDRLSRWMNERLQATTAEQRVEAYRQFERMRKIIEQFQQNPSAPPAAIPPRATP